MAVQIYKPRKPTNVVLRMFAMQTTANLRRNMRTQHVWPELIYPGFDKVNEERKRQGSWFATGLGAKSFSWSYSAVPGNESITISFNDYLRFVDMGVGQGRTFEDVQHERKARHKVRYVKVWSTVGGETHRPAIMMEMRHLQNRMTNYFQDTLGQDVAFEIVKTIDGMGINLNI